jgi:hypothetical protein
VAPVAIGEAEALLTSRGVRMKPKAIITGALLAFVAVSLGYSILKEARHSEPDAQKEIGPFLASSEHSPAASILGVTAGDIRHDQEVVAYYFYGNVRCQTCKKIEAYTADVISRSFTNELSTGLLAWKTANVDERENEHFVGDYELTSRAVVLVRMADGKQTEWKNLAHIWDLVGDKDAFQKYIADEAKAFLKKGNQ